MAISTSFLPSSLSLPPRPAFLSFHNRRGLSMVVRMGGGPRTFPGGVSKWQWKRMQEKKAKQLLKARLMRERQIYEMRKRAEIKEAVNQLERPWEAVQNAPNLFSVSVDEQVKTLADRFQKPGGFDMWNERDGPQVFNTPNEGLPSVRFFPKGAVHSIKPYTKEGEENLQNENKDGLRFDDWIARGAGGIRRTRSRRKNKHTTENFVGEFEVESELSNVGLEKGVDLSGNNGLRNGMSGRNDTIGVNVEKFEEVKELKGGDLGRNGWNKKNNTIGVNRRKNNALQGESVNVNKNFESRNGWERRKYGMKGANSNEGNFHSNRRFSSNNAENEGNFQRNGRFSSNKGENEGNFQSNRRFSSSNGENEGNFQRNGRFSSNNGENKGNFQRNGRFSSNNGENKGNFQRNGRFSSNNGENKGNFQRNGRFSSNNGENKGNFQRNGRFSGNNGENEGNFQRDGRFGRNGRFSSNRENEGNFQSNRRFASYNGENEGNFQRSGRFSSNNGENEGNFHRNGRFSSNGKNEGIQRNRRFSSNNGNLRLRPTSNLHYEGKDY